MGNLLGRMRATVRTVSARPAYASVVIVLLAIGSAVVTVTGATVYAVVFRPLPFPDSHRMQLVTEVVPGVDAQYPRLPANPLHFLQWRVQCTSCAAIVSLRGTSAVLMGADSVSVPGAEVSSGFFDVMGARIQRGRGFVASDEWLGSRVVVLTDGLWREHFRADPGIVGRAITFDGVDRTVVGVLSHAFTFPRVDEVLSIAASYDSPGYYVPMAVDEARTSKLGAFDYVVIALPQAGVSADQMGAELRVIQRRLNQEWNLPLEVGVAMESLASHVVAPARPGMALLIVTALALLLMTCANAASLMLTRVVGMSGEFAVRSALGASRRDVAGMVWLEGTALAFAGTCVGLAASVASIFWLQHDPPLGVPRLEELVVDWRLALFSVSAFAVTVVLVVVPALRAIPRDVNASLRVGGPYDARPDRSANVAVADRRAIGSQCDAARLRASVVEESLQHMAR